MHADNEADLDAQAGANRDADVALELEGIPLGEEVRVRREPQLQPVRSVHQFQPQARHHAGVGEREVVLALDLHDFEQVPAEAETRYHGVFGPTLEAGVVSAQGQQELRLAEPHEEGEAARELAILRDEPGVVGELRLNGQQHLRGGEARLQCQLHARQRRVVGRQRHACDAEQSDLDAAVERDVDHGGQVHHLEGAALESNRQPEGAARRRHRLAESQQRAERIVGQLFGLVQRLDQHEAWNLVDLFRHQQAAVETDAQANRLEHDDGRPAEGDEHAAENRQRGVLVAAGLLRHGITTHRDSAEVTDLDQQHAVVFDRVLEFHQAAGDGDAARREAEAQSLEIQRHVAGMAVRHGQRQVVDLRAKARDRHTAVDDQTGLLASQAHAHLVDVDRPELRVHTDPQHAAAAVHAHVQAIVLAVPDLDVDARRRRLCIATRAGTAHQRADHGIAAAARAVGQTAERLRVDVAEEIAADAADAHAGLVDQRLAVGAIDADAHAG